MACVFWKIGFKLIMYPGHSQCDYHLNTSIGHSVVSGDTWDKYLKLYDNYFTILQNVKCC